MYYTIQIHELPTDAEQKLKDLLRALVTLAEKNRRAWINLIFRMATKTVSVVLKAPIAYNIDRQQESHQGFI